MLIGRCLFSSWWSLPVSCDVVQKHWVMNHCLWLEPAVTAVPGWAHSCSTPPHAASSMSWRVAYWYERNETCDVCVQFYKYATSGIHLWERCHRSSGEDPRTRIAEVKHPLTYDTPQTHTASNNHSTLQHMNRLNSRLHQVTDYQYGSCQVGEHAPSLT